MYINAINYFRGISIIFIVFGHCMKVAGFEYNSIAGNTMNNLIHGGTTFFVFISGFLFQHIFYKTFDYKDFMTKKAKYVLVPYLLLSTIPILILIVKILIKSVLSINDFSTQYDKLSSFPFLQHYLTGIGNSYIGYWYIPFVMIIFAMSPLFIKFMKFNLKTSIFISLFLLIGSIFIHKPIGGVDYNFLSVFHNVFYFLPIFLFGIIFSEKHDVLLSALKGKEFYFLCTALFLAVFQASIGEIGNYHKNPFTFGGVDLMMFQKILLCFFFMIFLNRFENSNLKILKVIAANSFGIFFIHGIFIVFVETIKQKMHFSFTPSSFLNYVSVSSFIFIVSLLITILIKKVFSNYSRYIVGI